MTALHDVSVAHAVALTEAEGRARAPRDDEAVSLDEALGRVLARDLAARADHPNVDDSALDGYACRAADTAEATAAQPVRLRLVGDSVAGRPFDGTVEAGTAVRIQTGAALPAGADAVVPVEATREEGEAVWTVEPARPEAVRPRGGDVREGEVGLRRGRRLDAAAIALAATLGHARLPVARRPRVAVLSTGNELVPPGGALHPGAVFDGNTAALCAAVRAAGGTPEALVPAGDGVGAVLDALTRARHPDLLLTSGGISMGRFDPVRDLLAEEGTTLFRRVRVKPGGPTTLALWRDTPLLALPGNPVSAVVQFLVLGRAYLDRWAGAEGPLPYVQRLPARAATSLRAAGAKETLARVRLTTRDGALWAAPSGSQSSGVVRALAEADALAVLPPGAELAPGDSLEVVPLAAHLR